MTKYIIFVLFLGATDHDKQAIRAQWKQTFNDNIEISVSELPEVQRISNPAIKAKRLVVSYQQLKNCGVDLSNITRAKFDQWKENNLDNPNHFEIFVGDDWGQTLLDNGIESVPVVEEP